MDHLLCFILSFLFFQINVFSSRLMGFVFYNQVIALLVIVKPIIINKQDRPYIPHLEKDCLQHFMEYGTSPVHLVLSSKLISTLSLDLAVATYPPL